MSFQPPGFPVDDRPVYDSYIAGRRSAALAVAVRTGLFETVEELGEASVADVRARHGWKERPTRSLLIALSAAGLLTRTRDRFALTESARAYALRGRPGSLAALIDLEIEHFLTPHHLLTALESDDASVYGGDDPWESHEADPAQARAFTEAMHAVSGRPAAGFAARARLAEGARLLDVGGGSGALSIALAAARSDVRCTVFDLAVVCGVADEKIREAGLEDRVTTLAGDMFAPRWPTGHDAVLLSQILHDWSFDTGRELLRRAFDALTPGGSVLIHEKLVDDERDAPLANALVHLDMLVWTKGQQYRFGELRDLLVQVGFDDVSAESTGGYWTLVQARKPEPR